MEIFDKSYKKIKLSKKEETLLYDFSELIFKYNTMNYRDVNDYTFYEHKLFEIIEEYDFLVDEKRKLSKRDFND